MGPTSDHPGGPTPPRDWSDGASGRPRGQAQVPPSRVPGPESTPPPVQYPRGRAPLPPSDRTDGPRRPSTIGRASVRPGRPPAPATGMARVGPPSGPTAVRPSTEGRRSGRGLIRRLLSVTFALVLMLTGAGVVGASRYFDSVQLTTQLEFPETTQVLYSDGSVLARLGEMTRYELPYDRIIQPVKDAIVAAEDQTFWTNEGVDINGVLRAAWNNITGGTIQGGSTITQQYARLAYELKGVTYQRKVKEAILAWKMNDAMTKEQILEAYLNAVPFGRGAYGVEAAARVFFHKTADNTAPPEQQLTLAEAMVLVAMVKQPYPDPADPEGSPAGLRDAPDGGRTGGLVEVEDGDGQTIRGQPDRDRRADPPRCTRDHRNPLRHSTSPPFARGRRDTVVTRTEPGPNGQLLDGNSGHHRAGCGAGGGHPRDVRPAQLA